MDVFKDLDSGPAADEATPEDVEADETEGDETEADETDGDETEADETEADEAAPEVADEKPADEKPADEKPAPTVEEQLKALQAANASLEKRLKDTQAAFTRSQQALKSQGSADGPWFADGSQEQPEVEQLRAELNAMKWEAAAAAVRAANPDFDEMVAFLEPLVLNDEDVKRRYAEAGDMTPVGALKFARQEMKRREILADPAAYEEKLTARILEKLKESGKKESDPAPADKTLTTVPGTASAKTKTDDPFSKANLLTGVVRKRGDRW